MTNAQITRLVSELEQIGSTNVDYRRITERSIIQLIKGGEATQQYQPTAIEIFWGSQNNAYDMSIAASLYIHRTGERSFAMAKRVITEAVLEAELVGVVA